MTRNEVVGKIVAERRPEQFFIKLFKTGHRLFDLDRIEDFISTRDHGGDIDEYELLDMEQMWLTLIELDPDKLIRSGEGENEVIEWYWTDNSGIEKKTVFPFTPEGIMTIINDEFFA